MSLDLFISYAREDKREAEKIAKLLAERGWSVWWDVRIPAGSSFAQEIEQQLATARVVLVLWSTNSVGSSWVLDEAAAARDRKVLLPILIGDVQIPLGFRQTQAADLRTWLRDANDPAAGVLVEAVVRRLGEADTRESLPPAGTPKASRRRARRAGVLVAASALLAVGTFVGLRAARRTSAPSSLPERTFHRQYYQGFNASGPGADAGSMIDGLWHLGLAANNWHGEVSRGTYRLCNAASDTSLSYINRLTPIVDDKEVDMSDGRVSISLAVEPPNTTYSGVGVLFRASRDSSRFLAVLLNAGPAVSLLHKNGRSMKILWSDQLQLPTSTTVPLRVEGNGPVVDIYVGDRLIHSQKDVDLLSGDVGVFAYSTGCFVIDDIAVYAPAQGSALHFKPRLPEPDSGRGRQ